MIWCEHPLSDQLLLIGTVENNLLKLYIESESGNSKTLKEVYYQDIENVPVDDLKAKYGNIMSKYIKKSPSELLILKHAIDGDVPDCS